MAFGWTVGYRPLIHRFRETIRSSLDFSSQSTRVGNVLGKTSLRDGQAETDRVEQRGKGSWREDIWPDPATPMHLIGYVGYIVSDVDPCSRLGDFNSLYIWVRVDIYTVTGGITGGTGCLDGRVNLGAGFR